MQNLWSDNALTLVVVGGISGPLQVNLVIGVQTVSPVFVEDYTRESLKGSSSPRGLHPVADIIGEVANSGGFHVSAHSAGHYAVQVLHVHWVSGVDEIVTKATGA
jgi:hypothetical protein